MKLSRELIRQAILNCINSSIAYSRFVLCEDLKVNVDSDGVWIFMDRERGIEKFDVLALLSNLLMEGRAEEACELISFIISLQNN